MTLKYVIIHNYKSFKILIFAKEKHINYINSSKNLLRLSGLYGFLFWTICFVKQSFVHISPDLIPDFSGSFKLESFKITQRSTLKKKNLINILNIYKTW